MVALDQIVYENEARSLKSLKIQTFCRCNEGTIDDAPVKNPNPTGCNVIETIIVLKFPQVKGFSRCNEGTIGVVTVNNPIPTGCSVKETISVLEFPQVQGSLQLAGKVALDQIAHEIEARGLKSLKMLGFSRCNEGTIGDEAVNNPNPRGCDVRETIGV